MRTPTLSKISRTHRRRHVRRGVLHAFLVACICLVICATSALLVRSVQEHLGAGVVEAPTIELAASHGPAATGAFQAQLSYSDMTVSGSVEAVTTVAWDDEWFFQDPDVYNHELATTCAVLSAIANAESAYYQPNSGAPAYTEEALSKLGFSEVSTTSYQYRSQIIDELLNLVTNHSDVVAYSLASKQIRSSEGETRTLLLVMVRGSYGSEWLSNVNLDGPATSDDESPSETTGTGEGEATGDPVAEAEEDNHFGFMTAAQGVIDDLSEHASESADEVVVLLCGHSRGGAIANLAAAYADDIAQTPRAIAARDAIYAYTFAAPRSTTAPDMHDEAYGNIFNLAVPSDLVPNFPLESWGYGRFGVDLELPGYADEVFVETYPIMQAAYLRNTGIPSQCDPLDERSVDELVEKLEEDIPTPERLRRPSSLWSLATRLLHDIDLRSVIGSHYPSTYIAWMQAIDSDDLQVW